MSGSILYLHGFCSSPASWKSRLLAEALNARAQGHLFFCPALSHVPDAAIAQAELIIDVQKKVATLLDLSMAPAPSDAF